MLILAILIYAAAMTLANLSIAHFGPWVSPINAFVLIGLDLALRDWLHMRLKAWQMLVLIGASGVLTYALNPSAQHIVIASAAAFTLAATMPTKPLLARSRFALSPSRPRGSTARAPGVRPANNATSYPTTPSPWLLAAL